MPISVSTQKNSIQTSNIGLSIDECIALLNAGKIRNLVAPIKLSINSSLMKENKFCQVDWLPGLIFKWGGNRIEGANKLIQAINKYNLDLLKIPEQVEYTIPKELISDLPESISIPDILCIAKYLPGKIGLPLNLNQAKQLIKLSLETNYWDLKRENLVHCEDDTIGLIDTESRGFAEHYNSWRAVAPGATLPEDDLLERLHMNNKFTPEAQIYVELMRNKYKKKDI